MVAFMDKKSGKPKKTDGREIRYQHVPSVKLKEWSEKLKKFSDAINDAYEMAKEHDLQELKIDGGHGVDKVLERVKTIAKASIAAASSGAVDVK